MISLQYCYFTMGILDAVALWAVFSLGCFIQTKAVPIDRENITAYGNITLSPSSSNVTGEKNNHSKIISRSANTTNPKEIKIDTKSNPRSHNQQMLHNTAPGKIYKGILQTLQLKDGMKIKDIDMLLHKLGLKDCSRQTKHKVATISQSFVSYGMNPVVLEFNLIVYYWLIRLSDCAFND